MDKVLEPQIYEINGFSRYDTENPPPELDQLAKLEVVHDRGSDFSNALKEQLSGIPGSRIIQIRPIEGGGGGAPELVTYIFEGLQVSIHLVAGGFLAELGAMGVRKVAKILSKKPDVTRLLVSKGELSHEIEVILPKNLSEADIEIVFSLVEEKINEKPRVKIKVVYDRSGKKLEDLSPPGWEN